MYIIEIFHELKEKNRKSRNQARKRLKRALENGERKPRKNKKRGSMKPTGSSSKMNHLQNLAQASEPDEDKNFVMPSEQFADEDEEEEDD